MGNEIWPDTESTMYLNSYTWTLKIKKEEVIKVRKII